MAAAQPFQPNVRHVQLFRALLSAIAAAMITFSPDHSAALGLAVFSGWAIASALVMGIGVWTVIPRGARALPGVLAGIYLVAGMTASVPPLRVQLTFYILLPIWALLAGLAELAVAIAQRRAGQAEAGDARLVAILTFVVGIAVAVVPSGYTLDYFVGEADRSFTLTGDIIAVGLFGAYTAIVAVFLGIAGFSPLKKTPAAPLPAGQERS